MAAGGWLMVLVSRTRNPPATLSGSRLFICSSVVVVVMGPSLDAPGGAGRFLGRRPGTYRYLFSQRVRTGMHEGV